MAQPVLGIMTIAIQDQEERSYFRKLIIRAKRLGMQAFVFTPLDVNDSAHRIRAHLYEADSNKWTRGWMPFPHIIYDRCRYKESELFRRFRRFRQTYPRLIYMNRPISNKWGMHQFLAKSAEIRPHLPDTRVYSDANQVVDQLRIFPLLYLKPINGTGGRGILRVQKQRNGYILLQGRERTRRIMEPKLVTPRQLPGVLSGWNLKNKYLIQQGIRNRLSDGRVFDFRLLIQKNGNGEWAVTGCAGRVGPRQSITSNLHGGGQAYPMAALLRRQFQGEDKVDSIRDSVYKLGENVAKTVEEHFGQLCELGIDIAIDPDGHPWLLELNPKPAREVFARIGEKDIYETAIMRPLEYALWLYQQHVRKPASSSSRVRSRSLAIRTPRSQRRSR